MTTATPAVQDPFVEAFPELKAFWEASARGEFLVPRCTQCGKVHWHPRAHCPFCHAPAIGWVPASGRGVVHSFSVIRRPNAPYVLAYVRIEEGPILMTNVVDCDLDAVRIDMLVRVSFRPTVNGRQAPVFRPA